MMREVPLWEKSNLTLEEAAAYSGIGINKLRNMTDEDRCDFVLWNGSKRLIKRRKLDEYTDKVYSIQCHQRILAERERGLSRIMIRHKVLFLYKIRRR